jgi:hypothetical protein
MSTSIYTHTKTFKQQARESRERFTALVHKTPYIPCQAVEPKTDGWLYTVYQIENTISGEYYIGSHKTKNLDDGYFGSGIALSSEFETYGKGNFRKEIICICSDKDEMLLMEQYLIQECARKGYDLLNRKLPSRCSARDLHAMTHTRREKSDEPITFASNAAEKFRSQRAEQASR